MQKLLQTILTLIILLGSNFSFAQAPIAYYPFNGNANDESGNGYDGTENGGVTLTTDRFGTAASAYSFDGSSGYIILPSNTIFDFDNQDFTLSVWIKPITISNDNRVINYGGSVYNQYLICAAGTNTIYGGAYVDGTNGTTDPTNIPIDNQWHHLTFVRDNANNTVSFYVDAILRSSNTGGSGTLADKEADRRLTIGRKQRTSGQSESYFHGDIDDVRIYNRALTSNEVDLIFHETGWDPLEQGLIADYPFNGNANDESGYGYDGTEYGGITLTTDRFGKTDSAYYFDGFDDKLTMPSGFINTGTKSISLWFNTDILDIYQVILDNDYASTLGNGIRIVTSGSSLICSARNGNDANEYLETDPIPIKENSWYHVVMVEDENIPDLKVYINGFLYETDNTSEGTETPGTSNVTIGADATTSVNPYKGIIDDIRIYNRALDQSEVICLFQENNWDPLTQGLVASYPFNGDANDESGNGNDGTPSGAILAVDQFGNSNSAFFFDEVADEISVPHSSSFDFGTGDFSIDAFFKTDGTPTIGSTETTMVICEKFNLSDIGYSLNVFTLDHPSDPGKIYFSLGFANYIVSDKEVVDNNWHHVVAQRFNSDSLAIFIDGQLDSKSKFSSVSVNTTFDFKIGHSTMVGTVKEDRTFNGSISEVALRNRVLSTSEIFMAYANYYPPDSFNVDNLSGQVILTWDSTNWENLDKVYIYRDNTLTDSVEITSSADTIYEDQETVPWMLYSYFIQSKDIWGNVSISSDTLIVSTGELVSDYDGNSYETVKISNQVWMRENLKTTQYNDGTAITSVTDNTAWSNLTTEAYCWYNNDELTYSADYGALYNWYAVETGKLCPAGWQVPTDNQWTILSDFLGGESVAGDKLKETGTDHWPSPNSGATNEYGFSAMPGGMRFSIGTFQYINENGYWWTSSEADPGWSWLRVIPGGNSNINTTQTFKVFGYSIRCLKDTELTDGLIAHYPFNGNANDESGNGYDGTENGGVTLTTDRFGNANSACSFDGATSTISVSSIDTTFSSLLYWFSLNQEITTISSQGAGLFQNTGPSGIFLGDASTSFNNELITYTSSGTTNSYYWTDTQLGFDKITPAWHQIAVLWDDTNSNYRLYFDNIDYGLAQIYGSPGQLRIENLEIGVYGSNYFDGIIDDLRMYNRVLSPSEIDSLFYENGWDPLSQSLIAHYPFDGNPNDATLNNLDGTITGGTTLSSDRFGNDNSAYSFNGTDGYINTPDDMLLDFGAGESISLAFWARSNNNGDSFYYIQKGYGGSTAGNNAFNYAMGRSSNKINFTFSDDNNIGNRPWTTTNDVFLDTGWHYIVMNHTFGDGSNSQLYIDGDPVAGSWSNGTGSEIPQQNDIDLLIGSGYTAAGDNIYFIDGAMDDVRIYNRMLSQDEIDSLYFENGWGIQPEVLSISPAQNAGHVNKNENVSVSFSIDVDQASVDSTTFTVRGGYTGQYGGTYSVDNGLNTATFNPTNPFKPGETIWITLTQGITGLGGDSLLQAYNTSFTVETTTGKAIFSKLSDDTVGLAPTHVITADFNNDNNLDLAAANQDANTISVLISNGDGSFQPDVEYPTGNSPTILARADFNDDGVLDLAVTHYSTDNDIAIFIGNGDGTFQTRIDIMVGDYPRALFPIDLNGDGIIDLAVGNSGSDLMTILFGIGDGSFTKDTDYVTGDFPNMISGADFDRDGDIDLALTTKNESVVSVYLNYGDGTFTSKTDYSTAGQAYCVEVADLDNDSIPDLAVGNVSGSLVSILLGNGDGTFASRNDYDVGAQAYYIVPADYDNDGIYDLVITHWTYASDITFLKGLGDGTFDSDWDINFGNGPLFHCAGDFNNDGSMDLALPNNITDDISILINNLLDSSLIAWYPFTGNASDSTDNNLDGTLNGGVTLTTDRYGNADNAYNFDGSDDYINVPHASILDLSAYTLSAWVMPRSYPDIENGIVEKGIIGDPENTNYSLYLTQTSHFVNLYEYNSGSINVSCVSNAHPLFNHWYHVTGSYDGNDLRIYINGRLDNIVNHITPPGTNASDLVIGARDDEFVGFKFFFDGVIDEVRVYKKALSDLEAVRDYANYYPPDSFTIERISDQVVLAWDSTNWEYLDKVYVYRDEVLYDSIQVASSADTIYIDPVTNLGTKYSYFIRSRDNWKNISLSTDTLYITVPLEEGLVAYYPLNGNANDTSGYENNGTENGGVTLASDRFGNTDSSFSFDGVDDYISVNNDTSLKFTNNLTISAWYNVMGSTTFPQFIFSKWDGSNGNESFYIGIDDYDTPVGSIKFTDLQEILPTGQNPATEHWNYLSMTYNGVQVLLYVNGVPVDTINETRNILSGTLPLVIGGRADNTDFFNGLIDECRLYNDALSHESIMMLYENFYPPASFEADTISDQIILTWDSTNWEYLDKVYVFRDEVLYDSVQIVTSADTLYTDPGTNPGITYTYFIQSKDNWGNVSISSDTLNATIRLEEGLVAYYPFNGNANDSSGYKHDGSENGGVIYQDDRFGNTSSALNLDGIDDWVEVTSSEFLHFKDNDFTVSFWFNWDGGNGELIAIGGVGGGCLEYRNFIEGNKFKTTLQGISSCLYDDYPVVEEFDTGAWYFYTIARVDDMFNIYENGILLSTFLTSSDTLVNSGVNLVLGFGDEFYKGLIDEVRIYNNRALNEGEILELYENYYAPPISGTIVNEQPVVYWDTVNWNYLDKVYVYRDNILIDSVIVSSNSDTTYIDSDIIPDTSYSYFIQTLDQWGNRSVSSDTIIITTPFDSLIAWYPFTSNLLDSSAYHHDGILPNDIGFHYDRFGNDNHAAYFDGVDDTISISSTNKLHFEDRDFTMSFWFNWYGGDGELISIGNSHGCQEYRNFIEGNRFKVTFRGDTSCVYDNWPLNEDLESNVWYFYTIIRNNDSFRIYVNGVMVSEFFTSFESLRNSGSDIILGFEDSFYHGLIDDVKIFETNMHDYVYELYGNYHAPALSAALFDTQPTLSWNSINWEYLDKVYVYRDEVLYDSMQIASVADTIYRDPGSSPGMRYSYFVRSRDIWGNLSISSDTMDITHPKEPGLVAYYPFSGNANDESGYGNDGTENGGVALTTDRYGNLNSAYEFDGVDDHIEMLPVETPDGLTVSAWVKLHQYSSDISMGQSSIVSQRDMDDNWELTTFDGIVNFAIWDNDALLDTTTLSLGEYYHVVGSFDGIDMKIYINGKITTSIVANNYTIPYSTNSKIHVGSTITDYLSGDIDDIRIYNRGLSDNDIRSLYANYYPPDAFNAVLEDNKASLSWDSLSWQYLDKIYIYRDEMLYDSVQVVSRADTVYGDPGSSPGMTYSYFIQSRDIWGNRSISSDTVNITTPPDSLIAWYTFDGHTVDSSAYHHNGIPSTGLGYDTDRFGNPSSAALFNGVSDSISVPSSTEAFHFGNSDFTVSYWANWKANGDIIRTGDYGGCNEYRNMIENDKFKVTLGGSTGTDCIFDDYPVTEELDTGIWYFFTVTRNNNTFSYYKNGVKQIDFISSDQSLSNDGLNMVIGHGDSFYNGMLDDMLIYNAFLIRDEIYQLYGNYHAPKIKGVVNNQQAVISWDSTNWNFLDKIFIYRDNILIDSVDITNDGDTVYQDTRFTADAICSYFVRSRDIWGNWSISSDTISISTYETVTDYDGNTYNAITIGEQVWMKENLKTTHYSDGTPLINGAGAGDIADDITTKYYFAYEDSVANIDTYGLLYTWAAAMNGESSSDKNPSDVQGVCPTGWHLPSDDEWKELEMHLGMSQSEADQSGFRGSDEGGKLKETGTDHWQSPNTGATNESGFTGLPGGFRLNTGDYRQLERRGHFWSSTENDSVSAFRRILDYDSATVDRDGTRPKNNGRSIRCVKDDTSAIPIDISPPEIILSGSNSGVLSTGGSGVDLSAAITDISGIKSAQIIVTRITDESWIYSEDMTNDGSDDIWSTTIGPSIFDEIGVFYHVQAIDSADNTGYSDTAYCYLIHDDTEPIRLTGLKSGIEQSAYQIISIPVNSRNIQTQLIPALGDSKGDSEWRLGRYFHDGGAVKYHPNITIEFGGGYWLIIKESQSFDFQGGISLDDGQPVVISLDGGWNQIGNPYPFDIYWSDVLDYNGNPPGISPDLRTWLGTGYHDGANHLPKFTGAFVKSSTSIDLEIPLAKNSTGGGRIGENQSWLKRQEFQMPEWFIPFEVRTGNLTDLAGGVGMIHNASIKLDHYDKVALPRFMDFVEINFPHPDEQFKRFSADIVDLNPEYRWDFSIETNIEPESVSITWSEKDVVILNNRLVLFDKSIMKLIDMSETSTYKFTGNGIDRFSIVFGSDEYIMEQILPDHLTVGNPYPNPFTNDLIVPFSIPINKSLNLEIIIYDLQGRLILKEKVEKVSSGMHKFVWDGRDMRGDPVRKGLYQLVISPSDQPGNEIILKKIIKQ
ncbi:LamG-like jellyroll fold domain-containing protein [Bacteroidota bacterium]